MAARRASRFSGREPELRRGEERPAGLPCSTAKLPYHWALDGISNTQTINPGALGHNDEERAKNPVQVMDGYFMQGAHHLNVNVFGTEAHRRDGAPEKEEYANFTIRVSGYAVKFIDLTREQQARRYRPHLP